MMEEAGEIWNLKGTWPATVGFEYRWGGHKPRNADNFVEAEKKVKEWILTKSIQKGRES